MGAVTVWLPANGAAFKRQTRKLAERSGDHRDDIPRQQPGDVGGEATNQGRPASSTLAEWHRPHGPPLLGAPPPRHVAPATRDDFINILPADQ